MTYITAIILILFGFSCSSEQVNSKLQTQGYSAIENVEEFIKSDVSSSISRTYDLETTEIASRILDFENNCDQCKYPISYVKDVKVIESSDSSVYLWQHIQKGIWLIKINSYSVLKVTQYKAEDNSKIVIDMKSPEAKVANKIAQDNNLKNDASFEFLHIRAIISKTETGSKIEIKVTAKPQGIAKRAPRRILKGELESTTRSIADAIE